MTSRSHKHLKPREDTQGLARVAGLSPYAGRNIHVRSKPGRRDHPALRKGIAVSKMYRLRYARENGYGGAARTPTVAIPAGDIGRYRNSCNPFSVGSFKQRCRA